MVSYGIGEFPDYYYHYKRKENTSLLEYENNYDNVFFAKDEIDFSTGASNDFGISKRGREYLTIKTPYNIDFKPKDRVYDVKGKKMWVIMDDGITVIDDNSNKKNSLMPRKYTILKLIR